MGRKRNRKILKPLSVQNSIEDNETLFEDSGFEFKDDHVPIDLDQYDWSNSEDDEPIPKKSKLEEVRMQTDDTNPKDFLKFLKQMKRDKKRKGVDNDYSKILTFLNEFNRGEKKHNYVIANRHRRSLNLQNCKDVVNVTKNDLDVVEENLQKSKQEAEGSLDKQIFQKPLPFNPNLTFKDMHCPEPMLKALNEMGIKTPTDIQKAVIPEAIRAHDVVASASTGSGKTLAFLLPTAARLFNSVQEKATRVLIITPSREIALQIYEVGTFLCKYTDITFTTAVGGVKAKVQRQELQKKPDFVIATPGRLICHMVGTRDFSFEDVEMVIIDEADQMLNPDFTMQLKPLLQRCRKSRQTLLFSATMTETVKDLSVACLRNPVRVFMNKSTEVPDKLHQEFILLKKGKDIARVPALVHLVLKHYQHKVMIFAQMKIQCTYAFILLSLLGLRCAELHSDKDQDERTLALDRFRNEEIDILICTEVGARGLDIQGVETIINLNPPDTYEKYVHRVGRTARAGTSGKAVTIINESAKPEMLILENVKKYSKGPLTRRHLVDGYMGDFTNIINKLTPMVEEIYNNMTEAKAKKDEISLLERPAGKKGFKPKKPQKSSKLSFDEAMAEPKKKPDKSRIKYEMKLKRGLKK